jgi:SAM-dependent methyltransferase
MIGLDSNIDPELARKINFKIPELIKSSFETPLVFENGLYYWNSCGTKYGRVKEDFEDKLPEIVNGDILDIGCSFGETTREISDKYKGSKVTGIDTCYERIAFARENNPNCEFLVQDGYNPNFEEHSFDGVFCMNNLWYLISKKRFRVKRDSLLRISTLVKDGGYLLFSGNNSGVILRNTGRWEILVTNRIPELNSSPVIDYLTKTLIDN